MPERDPLLNPLDLGARVEVGGDIFTISSYVDLNTLIGIRVHDGERVRLAICDIVEGINAKRQQLNDSGDLAIRSSGLELRSEAENALIELRASVLGAFLADPNPTRKLAEEAASKLGVAVATVYRWRNKYLNTGDKVVLAPHKPNGGRGKSRLDGVVEGIVGDVINEKILHENRMTPERAMVLINARCRRAQLKPPHVNTLYRRIKAIPPRKLVRARRGKDAAKRFEAFPGQFPGADYPNAVWQIDHTPLDIELIDDVYGKNIRRPWLTVAIDVFSRCVVGLYLSLDTPNATSVGMCIVNAILPKQGWLAAHGLASSWPIYGKPATIHADNGSDFKCETVTQACSAHHIRMEWRAVGKPHWGGHIERLLGTVNREIHTLPGTTFSGSSDKGKYPSHKKATFTFDRIEKYVADFICGIYHQRDHGGLRRAPIRVYEDGLLGDGMRVGTGLPPPIADPERLRLDFLPFELRSVQQYGISIDNITYYAPVLDRWIRAMDPSNPKRTRRFVIRYDKRDISHIYFLDPTLDRYFKIPYRRVEHPSLTAWELEDVRKELRKERQEEVDEDLIFATYERLSQLTEEAQASTSMARRKTQRKLVGKRRQVVEGAQIEASIASKSSGKKSAERTLDAALELNDDDVIEPFETVEVGMR